MTRDIDHIFTSAKRTALSQEEKGAMREKLVLFMEHMPVRDVRNSDVVRLHHREEQTNTSNLSTNTRRFMPIAIIIALMLGAGTSFAAESALPGDKLYPVKIYVNEETRAALAVSAEEDAKWSARRAERRLEEMERLASEGRFSAEAQAEAAARFQTHMERFDHETNDVEEKGNINAAIEIRSETEASLRAHQGILASISGEGNNVADILLRVGQNIETVSDARGDAEIRIMGSANVETKTAAEGKAKAARAKIAEVKAFLAKNTVSADVNAKLNLALEAMAHGEAKMEASSYGEAFIAFQKALRLAQEAKIAVEAGARLHLDLPLVSGNVNARGEASDETETDGEAESETSVEVGSEGEVEVPLPELKLDGKASGTIRTNLGL